MDPRTGRRNLRSRPSISEITRPKSARIKLKTAPGSGGQHLAYKHREPGVTLESMERIDKRPATALTRTIVDLKL